MSVFHDLKVGIIGGSGLENLDIFTERVEKNVTTPYGKPSDSLITGNIEGVPCVILSRHGRKHNLSPTAVNYRANIYALKEEGCTHLIATTACGSLQEHIHPGEVVLIDQFIDRTTQRSPTLFDGTPGAPLGICHMQMGEPFCKHTRSVIARAAESLNIKCHTGGTVVTIEGPRFSSKAESMLYRSWGCDVVNMTTIPEVTLAKEAGLCYASIALPTDYDSWRGEPVNVDMVIQTMKKNAEFARRLIVTSITLLSQEDCADTVKNAKELVKTSVMLP